MWLSNQSDATSSACALLWHSDSTGSAACGARSAEITIAEAADGTVAPLFKSASVAAKHYLDMLLLGQSRSLQRRRACMASAAWRQHVAQPLAAYYRRPQPHCHGCWVRAGACAHMCSYTGPGGLHGCERRVPVDMLGGTEVHNDLSCCKALQVIEVRNSRY